MGFGYGFIGHGGAPAPNVITNFVWLNNTAVLTAGSVTPDVTFSGTTLGTARSTRFVVCVLWDIGDNNTPSGADIGGVTATILYDPTSNPHSPYVFGALVPTNANTDVVIHYPATQAGSFILSIYTMDGTPATSTGQFFSGLPASFVGLSVTGKANGAVIAGFFNGKAAGSPSTTWNQGAATMTVDFTNVIFTTANFVSGRSKTYLADTSQDWGSMSGGTAPVKAFLLALNP